MKVIKTAKFKEAQQVYNPDIGEFEDLDTEYETFDLPVMTKEDIGGKIPQADDDNSPEIDMESIDPIEADQSDFPQFNSTYEAMQWAIDTAQEVRVHYNCSSGPFIIRDIEPHGVYYAETTDRNILVSWDNDMDWYRSFAIPNIQKYEWKGEYFDPKFIFQEKQRNLRRR